MLKLIVLAICLVAVTADKDARVLKNDLRINPEDGSYQYAYETDNGIRAQEQGVGGVSATGEAEYQVDGQTYRLTYVADENGFQPQGDHIHPVPELIARALEYLRSQAPRDGPSLKL